MGLASLRNKKITFFVPEAPPSFAGAGVNAFQFAHFLSAYTKQTTLCHLNYNRQQDPISYENKLKICRIAYYNWNLLTKIGSFPNLLCKYFREIYKADIILIYSGYIIGFQLIIIIGACLGKKLIFRSSLLEGDDIQTLINKNILLRSLNRYSLGRISLYFAINHEFTQRWEKYFNHKIPVFQSFQGIDESRFFPIEEWEKRLLKEKLGLNEDMKVIVTVGIVLKRKGYDEVFKVLSNLNSEFIYIILGENKKSTFHHVTKQEELEMNELGALGKKSLGQKILFAGAVPNPEIYYQVADIYIQGSKQEGTPNALLEAMACGVACIVRELPGIEGSSIIHNDNAFIFSQYHELPTIIEKLFNNSDLRFQIGRSASKGILENYTFEKVANQLLRKIDEQKDRY
jgi:glycosyltransferase involved in cell wall biosynthesis